MPSPPPLDSNCSHCNRARTDAEPAFQRCSRCKTSFYCSQACQRSDWKQHKKSCSQAEPTAGPTIPGRATVRMNLTSLDKGNDVEDLDVIYYLRESIPHIKHLAIQGPYHNLEWAVRTMAGMFEVRKSDAGLMYIKQLWNDESVHFGGVAHVNAPLPDGNMMMVEIVKRKEPDVAAYLRGNVGEPKTVYNVFEVMLDIHDVRNGFPTAKERNITAVFTSRDAAEASVRATAETWRIEHLGLESNMTFEYDGEGNLGGALILSGRPSRLIGVIPHLSSNGSA